MALASYQKLTRVLTGLPFGTGSDGDLSSATIPSFASESCSGTSGSSTLTTSGTTLSDGDVILLHQTRGTGAGQWEINRVSSGGGTTTITLQQALQFTYTDSGASQAQAVVVPQYDDVTVQSGTWTIPAWDGNKGGVFAFACKGDLTVTGTITGNGGDGSDLNDGGQGPNQGGFRGGFAIEGASSTAGRGEGTNGDRSTYPTGQNTANGNGAGGGLNGNAAGGGGGNATAGSVGSTAGGTGGAAGAQVGNVELTTLQLGGAGGGGVGSGGSDQGSGANGGAALFVFAKNIASVNSITLNGGIGGSGSANCGGGGGAGGSALIQCRTATLGTAKITASAGTGTNGGGNGSAGRIAVHHSGDITGTTSPTFNDTTDGTLIESFAGLLNLFV